MRLKLKFLALFLFTTTMSLNLQAQDYSDPVGEGEIIVERMKDNTAPYKERRSQFGILFAVNYEKFNPSNYYSIIQNQNYHQLLGDTAIPIVGAEFGVKYNFSLGSVTALVGYGQGTLSNEELGIDNITASITKAGVNLALDNMLSEPYIVPFVQVGVHSIDWSESGTVVNVSQEENFTTDYNFHYKVGFSFQLNWIEKSIDPSSQEDALRSSGLENTFIDLFYTSYSQPAEIAEVAGTEGEADISSSEIGVGLKLEF